MQKKWNILLGLLTLLLTVSACRKDGTSETNFVFDLEDEFAISLIESLSSNASRSLKMDISSLREFDCENYTLNSSFNIYGGDRIRVSVTELISPEDCIGGPAPAIGQVDLGYLEHGNYQLDVFLVNQIDNSGTLIVHPDYYEIQLEEENGIVLSNTRLNKVPEETIWGYVGYENVNDISIVEELMNDMVEFLQPEDDLVSGNYGHYTVLDNNQIVLPHEEITNPEHLTFIFHLNGNIFDLQQKVDQIYCPQYKDQIDLKIYSSEGVVIECF